MPFGFHMYKYIYASFVESVLASFFLASIVLPGLPGGRLRRVALFPLLVLFARGRVFAPRNLVPRSGGRGASPAADPTAPSTSMLRTSRTIMMPWSDTPSGGRGATAAKPPAGLSDPARSSTRKGVPRSR